MPGIPSPHSLVRTRQFKGTFQLYEPALPFAWIGFGISAITTASGAPGAGQKLTDL